MSLIKTNAFPNVAVVTKSRKKNLSFPFQKLISNKHILKDFK